VSTVSTTPARRAVILIVDGHEWASRSLESVLTTDGHRVTLAHTASQALEAARVQRPDLLLINSTLPNGDGIELCRALRQDAQSGVGLPILMTASEPPSRTRRLAALRAGAWEFLFHPIDAEDLKLRLHSYLEARFELDRIRELSLVDELTGLYSIHGLERRTEEITSVASREGQAVACVVLAPTLGREVEQGPADEGENEISGAAVRWGSTLRNVGRISDAIGRLGQLEFAVIAPSTDGDGAIKMAERLAQALRSTVKDKERTSFDLRGGFEAIPNVRETSLAPSDLLVHAAKALNESKRLGTEIWLQAYQSE
jgi:PleD family two-component response regulator